MCFEQTWLILASFLVLFYSEFQINVAPPHDSELFTSPHQNAVNAAAQRCENEKRAEMNLLKTACVSESQTSFRQMVIYFSPFSA